MTQSTNPDTTARRWLPIVEAAGYVGLSRSSLERLIAQGKLTRYKARSRVLVDLDELDALVVQSAMPSTSDNARATSPRPRRKNQHTPAPVAAEAASDPTPGTQQLRYAMGCFEQIIDGLLIKWSVDTGFLSDGNRFVNFVRAVYKENGDHDAFRTHSALAEFPCDEQPPAHIAAAMLAVIGAVTA
ncbi:excisionase family DNA-binding protein [Tessaracoccus palaemonis]|uniref:Excisionase family DNA-binding protein n=1 Tax=Tessaracoccus palaemonis TaxID=2829499 RepID=A0ABX8SH53_9ACTN|nr:excisionase family DNA-binding protein [Tessaracoccus palaemonis]QXT62722.1 excisionase family DNA-binding protein [Tessaracoccus palaemonis]